MKARQPRPPVAEQGASRAYREGRLTEPGDEPTAPKSRLQFVLVWIVEGLTSVSYVTIFTLFLLTPREATWLLFPALAGLYTANYFLAKWSSARPPASRRDWILFVVTSTAAALWTLLLVLASIVWHLHGAGPFFTATAVGVACWFSWSVALYRTRLIRWGGLRR